jgi:hypothetical protein
MGCEVVIRNGFSCNGAFDRINKLAFRWLAVGADWAALLGMVLERIFALTLVFFNFRKVLGR